MKEYTEEKSAWYLLNYNKIADENGENLMLEKFEVPGLTIEGILQAFHDFDYKKALEEGPVFYFEITTKEQAQGIQKYVKNHVIDLDKYYYSLDDLQTPRLYTMFGFKKLIERNDIKELAEAVFSFAQYNKKAEDSIKLLNMLDKFNERDIRFGRLNIISYSLHKDMKIDEELILYHLEGGIHDPDTFISNKTKSVINNVLSKENPKLYEYIKSKYDLYVPDDYYLA